jgi:hypothetical protein
MSRPHAGSAFDAAPYAVLLATEETAGGAGLQWEEPRDIFHVVIESAVPGLTADDLQVQYWHQHWPQHHIDKGSHVAGGRSGWMPLDDWFNGAWQTADCDLRVVENGFEATFRPITASEFADASGYDVTYRRTLKLRVFAPDRPGAIAGVEACTDSVWASAEVEMEWASPLAAAPAIQVYNGEAEGVESEGDSLRVTVWYTLNPDPYSFDPTVVTIRAPQSFSFAMNDLVSNQTIYVPDCGVLVKLAGQAASLSDFVSGRAFPAQKTVYDRIRDISEQTLPAAHAGMPAKRAHLYMVLGCEGGRQKFGVEEHCAIFMSRAFNEQVPARDTPRITWSGGRLVHDFGIPAGVADDRRLDDGYLPIVTCVRHVNGVICEQVAFATRLGADILSDEPMQGDDSVVCLCRLTFTNPSDEKRAISLPFASHSDAGPEALTLRDGRVYAEFDGREVIRYLIDAGDGVTLREAEGKIICAAELPPHASTSVALRIPYGAFLSEDEIAAARAIDLDAERSRVAEFWRNRVAAGAQIRTPEPWITDFHRAHLTHILITDEREPGADNIHTRVGCFSYGNFSNESVMITTDLDRRGYTHEAELRLDTWLKYQGTVGFPGNFQSTDGIFYGSGGYEHGGYNQHHGWVLWGMGEHYWYTRDRNWLEHAAPGIVKGCDWIIRERAATMRLDAGGNRVREYGFLPAGSLEDVLDFAYWLSTNAFTLWGFDNAARALADIGHPEAGRLVREAEAYRADLLAGWREAMTRAPVVKLRDGTWVPHFPSDVYRRGREFGWIRETLEGALHLIRCGVLEPNSLEATWIVKDYEDNLYLSDLYGYPNVDFATQWFSRGGFSWQPNLLSGPAVYAMRDEPKHFLRGYFNGFAVNFYPQVRMLSEHTTDEMDAPIGDHFKTSDEAQSTLWLRMMFAIERGDELRLGMLIPRYWLADGQVVSAERLLTYFGEVSLRIASEAGNGHLYAVIDPPTRNAPRAVVLRLRHPDEKPMARVTVNGREWTDFDPAAETIRVGPLGARTEVTAFYE